MPHTDRTTTAHGIMHSLLRIVVSLLFMQHGAQKLFGVLGGMGQAGATAEPFTLMWVAGVLEFFGGLLMLLGIGTRPVAFILAGEMAVAYFWRHLPNGFWPIENGGEPAAFFCFAFLFFAFGGPGPYSLDAMLARRRHAKLHAPAPASRSSDVPGKRFKRLTED